MNSRTVIRSAAWVAWLSSVVFTKGTTAPAAPWVGEAADKAHDFLSDIIGHWAGESLSAESLDPKSLDQNTHLEQLTGIAMQGVIVCLPKYQKEKAEPYKKFCEPLGKALCKFWPTLNLLNGMESAQQDRVLGQLSTENLHNGILAHIGRPRTATIFEVKTWESIIAGAWTKEPLPPEFQKLCAEALHQHLARFLYEATKQAFELFPEAWAAMDLHISGQQISLLRELNSRQIDHYIVSLENQRLLKGIANKVSPAVQPPPRQPLPAAAKFFGRGDLINDLTDRLRCEQRVEVWGGVGEGKTALAAEAVNRLVGRDDASLAASPFPQGLVFLDLYQLYKSKTLDTAWGALANAFDDSVDTALPARERATKACARRRALVVLEGAEELENALADFLSVLAPETTRLILTRDESQTTAAHRIHLKELLADADALALLRHLAGKGTAENILTDIQQRLGGLPLALTWAGSQLADGTEPPADFLRELLAQPFTALTEPGGLREHTLRWMFDRSVRRLAPATVTVLAAVARVAEPFDASLASSVGGDKADLKRLVEHSFLRLNAEQTGWQFAHALARDYARALPLAEVLLAKLGQWVVTGLEAADASYRGGAGHPALDRAIAHATSLLNHDFSGSTLTPVVKALVYHGAETGTDTIGVRRGRLDFARRALEAVGCWQEQAPDEMKKTSGWQRESSVSLQKLGDLSVDQGDLPGALRYFTGSQTIAERLAASDPTNAEWQRDLSVSLEKLGNLAVAQGDLPGASRYFTGSQTIAERLAASDPANAAWQRDLAVSLNKLGNLAVAQGDLPGALRYFTEGKTIAERLAASDPANAAWQRDLSVSLNKLGNLAVAQGDLPGALRYFTEDKAIAERLAASDPANAAWQRDLAVSLNKLGDLSVDQGDLPGALRYFTGSQTIAERLAASDPANAEWQRDLSVSLDRLGNLAVARGDLPGALRYFTGSQTIRERLAASDPANAEWRRDLSVSLNKLGNLAVAQGDLPGALRYFTGSQTIAERLAVSDPANAAWQRDLAVTHFKFYQFAQAKGDQAMADRELHACHTVLHAMKQRRLHFDPALEQFYQWIAQKFGGQQAQ